MDLETKRIQMNSAEAAAEAARAAYLGALPVDQQASLRLAEAQAALDERGREAAQLTAMTQFLLTLQAREGSATLNDLAATTDARIAEAAAEIDDLKSQIRRERRLFMDAGPSVSPAVGGLYFTRTPDNQVLIAFLSCFGAALLFVGLLVILGHIPLPYFEAMTFGERLKTVAIFWVAAVVIMWASFFVFT
jgi:hypothetical protein